MLFLLLCLCNILFNFMFIFFLNIFFVILSLSYNLCSSIFRKLVLINVKIQPPELSSYLYYLFCKCKLMKVRERHPDWFQTSLFSFSSAELKVQTLPLAHEAVQPGNTEPLPSCSGERWAVT